MSAISNSLLDAINKISESNVKASNATLTIECTITEVEDAGLQLYKVNYKDNTFDATSSSGSYNVGDIVYVLVPEGDFSKIKMIIGAVAPSSANLVEEEVTDDYIDISENLFGEIGDVNLCSYKSISPGTSAADISSSKDKILNYLNDGHRDFVFSMQIKTNLDLEQQRSGNYGISLHLPIVVDDGQGGEEHTEQILNMDINSILGNPYKLNNFTYQEIRYTFPDNVKQDNSEVAKELLLEKFVVNFPLQDSSKTDDDNDIFIKDISFKAVETLSAEHKQGYYLSLVCKDGNYFVGEDSKKVIEPVLKINGKSSKIDTEKQDCYWFIEDSSINASSPEYTYIAKNGQRCLNDLNLETSQYITNVLSYEVKKESVIAEVRYRCSLVNVSEQIQKDAYITLTNKNKVIECSLTTVDNITTYPKDMGNVNLIATVTGVKSSDRIDLAQRRLDLDTEKELDDAITMQGTSYVPIPNTDIGNQEGRASMPVSAISGQANKIICTFYISNMDNYGVVTQKILGTKEIIVWTTAEMTQHITVQNGDVLYKYDGNGNSPFVADYAYPYQAKKTIDDITFKVYKADGTELNEDEYNYCDITQLIPKNSMIIQTIKKDQTLKGDYYEYGGKGIEFQSLSYNIENVQNPKKTDNYIILKVAFKEEKLSEEINIKFVKEGESGTNGSAYTGMITFNGKTYDEINKDIEGNLRLCRLQLIYIKDGDQKGQYYNNGYAGSKIVEAPSSLSFGVKVYCNGTDAGEEVIYESPVYDLFDSKVTDPILKNNMDGTFSLKENPEFTDESDKGFCNIIKAEIKVGNPGVLYEKKEGEIIKKNDYEIIYAYYPIELIIIDKSEYFNQEEGGYVPYIADGYSQVLYASDGTNPQFDSTNPFRLDNKDSIINEFAKNYTFSQSATSNFRQNQLAETPEKCKFTPITKYNSGDSLNYIKVGILANDATKEAELRKKETEVNNFINELENKKDDLEDLKNKLLIELFQEINKFNEMSVSKDMESFLNKRQSILNKIIEFKKFIDGYKKTLGEDTDYKKNISELNTLREDLQNLGNYTTYDDIKIKINDIKALKMSGEDKLKKNTKKQFNTYVTKINELLQEFKNYSNKTENKNNIQSYIDLIKFLRGSEKEDMYIPSFDKKTYKDLNVYTDLVSLKPTYDGMIARLVGPKDTSGQIDDYSFVSTYVDIQNLINQIQNIFKKITESQYEEITDEQINVINNELDYRQKELAEIERILKCFNNGYLNIYRPILMLYNRYELSNVIGQDGNKLYTGDEGEDADYLLAPQIGAGRKNGNSFTGLIMGVRNHHNEQAADQKKANQVGLFGYSAGAASLFINAEDGSAIFGKSGDGQIIIDPNAKIKISDTQIEDLGSGLLYSYNYQDPKDYGIDGKPGATGTYYKINPNPQGMLINLTKAYIHFNDTGNDEESVGEAGKIYSGNHNKLDSPNKGFQLSRDGLSIGSKVKITEGGIAYFGTDAYKTSDKTKSPKCQTINGNNSASYIAHGTTSFDSGRLDQYDKNNPQNSYYINGGKEQVYIGTDGVRLGSQFAVDNNGNMVAKQLIAAKLIAKQDGEIGGQTIEGNQLKSNSNGMTIKGEGSLYGPGNNQYITSSGDAHFDDITCTNVFTIGKQGEGNNYQSSKDSGGGASSFSFGNGSIGLTASPSAGAASGDKITFTSSGGLKIEGDITARNGTFTGTIFAKDGNIGGQHINTDRLEQMMEGAVGGQLSSEGNALLSLITCSDVIVGEYLHETKLSAILREFNTRITNLENHNPH